MDPNEVLKRARECARRLNTRRIALAMAGASAPADDFDVLLDSFVALDQWITIGGFLPKEWVSNTAVVQGANLGPDESDEIESGDCRSQSSQHLEQMGYPISHPRCPGCGRPALDGKVTCGDVACGLPSGADRRART